ncbi:hypothetical protein [Streptomyces sp. NPDC098101]|uniref:hypothetical protein n=1 Tax=Streptomyces sp. NPDC098101 TaxID=3366096 RepID=UPI00381B0006
MARRTEYDEAQGAQRLKVPVTAFRWARHVGLVPASDVSPGRWSRAAIEALDAGAVRAAMDQAPISGGETADRIAAALGTPNTMGERAAVTSFVVRRLVTRGLLADLAGNPKSTLHHPGQVAEVCARGDPAELVVADTPLGPDQAAARLDVRCAGQVRRRCVVCMSSALVRLQRLRKELSVLPSWWVRAGHS